MNITLCRCLNIIECLFIIIKGCTRLAAASDKVYQLLARGRWFSPGTSASSTTKTGRHDIAEILLKVALSTINQIKGARFSFILFCRFGVYILMSFDFPFVRLFGVR
jgi:hypothetical protein